MIPLWILGAIVAVLTGLHKWVKGKEKEDEDQRKAKADEERSEEILRINRELLQKINERRIGEYLIAEPSSEEIDFFISHASEDKYSFVRALALELKQRNAKVFYDEFTLKVGDSLRRSIDRGLAAAKFGVVVLSEAFFDKEWPARELDGLVAREVAGRTRILPIWHKVTKDRV